MFFEINAQWDLAICLTRILLLNQLYVSILCNKQIKTQIHFTPRVRKTGEGKHFKRHDTEIIQNKKFFFKLYKTEGKALVISVSDTEYMKTSIFWFCVICTK